MANLMIQGLNGLSFSMLLFLIAAGLSLIFGLMRVINLAHGSFYMLGAYVGMTVIHHTGEFWLGLCVVALLGLAAGAFLQRFFLYRYYKDPLAQVLLTFGFLFIVSDASLWIWGGLPRSIPKPAMLTASIELVDRVYPIYRLFLIAVGVVAAGLLWVVFERSKLGAIIRAGMDDEQMAGGIGINMPAVFTLVFALGGLLAASAGVFGGPIIGARRGVDFDVLLLAFAVVIIGGLGSLRGAFVGSLVVGFIDTFGKVWFPELAFVTIYVPLAVILAIRPSGLFGRA